MVADYHLSDPKSYLRNSHLISIKFCKFSLVYALYIRSLHQKPKFVVPFVNTEPTCMSLSGHFMDMEGRVLVYQTENT